MRFLLKYTIPTFYLVLLMCCTTDHGINISGEIKCTTIVLKNEKSYCDLEIWHEVTVHNPSDSLIIFDYPEWVNGECLEHQDRYSDRLYLSFIPIEENQDDLYETFFSDSTLFRLAVNDTMNIDGMIPPKQVKCFILGMKNPYDKNLEMIDNLYLQKMKSEFIILYEENELTKAIEFKKSENYEIKFMANGKIVSKEKFMLLEEEDFL